MSINEEIILIEDIERALELKFSDRQKIELIDYLKIILEKKYKEGYDCGYGECEMENDKNYNRGWDDGYESGYDNGSYDG